MTPSSTDTHTLAIIPAGTCQEFASDSAPERIALAWRRNGRGKLVDPEYMGDAAKPIAVDGRRWRIKTYKRVVIRVKHHINPRKVRACYREELL